MRSRSGLRSVQLLGVVLSLFGLAALGGAAAATAAPIPTLPDLALAPYNLPAGPLQVGEAQAFDTIALRNLGATAAGGSVAFTVPAGFALSNGVQLYADHAAYDAGTSTDLTCTGTSVVTCQLPSMPTSPSNDSIVLETDIFATSAATPLTQVPLTVTVVPSGAADADASNNTITQMVQYLGIANLAITATPTDAQVTVGKTTTITYTVTNNGPQPAPTTDLDLTLLRLDHIFSIVNAVVRPATPPTGTTPYKYSWSAGTIDVGASVTVTVTARAVAAGTDTLLLSAISAASPYCPNSAPCTNLDVALTAVAAKPTATHTPAATSSTPDVTVTVTGTAQQALAATGVPRSGGQLIAGVVLVLVGSLVTFAGRSRARRRGRFS